MPSPTSIIVFGDNRDFYQEGLDDVFQATARNTKNHYKEWLREESTDTYYWTKKESSGLGVAPSMEIGAAFTMDKPYVSGSKEFHLVKYGLALEIQEEVLKFEKFGVYANIVTELAKTAVVRYDLEAFGVFNKAFSTSFPVYTNYNSEALCSATHTRLDGGTWKNRPTSPMSLSMMALEQADTDLRKTVNQRGLYDELTPTHLAVSSKLNWLARTLIMSDTNPENANEAYNNAGAMGLKIITSPYIDSDTAWFVLCDPKGNKFRMKMCHAQKPDTRRYEVPSTRNLVISTAFHFGFEIWDSRGMYGDAGV